MARAVKQGYPKARYEDEINSYLLKAFEAGSLDASLCRQSVTKFYRLGRIDLMGEWMVRLARTPAHDYRFLTTWISNPNPRIQRAAIHALGHSGEPGLIPYFIERLDGKESLPTRLELIEALGLLARPETYPTISRAYQARLENPNFLPLEEEEAIYQGYALIARDLLKLGRLDSAFAFELESLLLARWQSTERREDLKFELIKALAPIAGSRCLAQFEGLFSSPSWLKALDSMAWVRLDLARELVPKIIELEPPARRLREFLSRIADYPLDSEKRGLLFELDWLRGKARAAGDRSVILRLTRDHPWELVREDFLSLLDEDGLRLGETSNLIEALLLNRETQAGPKILERLRKNYLLEEAPLWFELLVGLEIPETREILLEYRERGLPGARLIADQLLNDFYL